MWFLLLSLAVPAAMQAAPAPLDLAALLKEAREANPALASARGRLAAAAAVPSQAEAPPDPLASVSFNNESLDDLTLGDSDDSFILLRWEQEVRYPGKRRLAGEVARRDAAVLASGVLGQQREIDARVIEAFAELYRVDRSMAILRRTRDLLGSLQETSRVRYEAGEGLLENVLTAGTEVSLLGADLELLTQARANGEASLRELLNAPGRSFGPVADLPAVAVPDPDALRSAALDNAVDIQAAD